MTTENTIPKTPNEGEIFISRTWSGPLYHADEIRPDTCLTTGGHCSCPPHGNTVCPTCTCNGVCHYPKEIR